MKRFDSLTEREVLALAISLEEEDARVYDNFAEGIAREYPASADVFRAMRKQEDGHRHRLLDLYRARFGEHIPLIRRQDVKGFVVRRPMWLMHPLRLDAIRSEAASMEAEVARFYAKAAQRATDAGIRQLLGDLAEEERVHEHTAERLEQEKVTPNVRQEEEDARRRLFVLQIVQPGLAGLMDGSVSTLAPLFAAAFASVATTPHDHWLPFKVGMAAAIGAGISMGFAEALSDDGSLTGRGHPWVRGIVCGVMTTIGGVGHTLPYLIPNLKTATALAIAVVVVELTAISYIRYRFMDTPFLSAAFQVIVGGVLVLLAGILLGVA